MSRAYPTLRVIAQLVEVEMFWRFFPSFFCCFCFLTDAALHAHDMTRTECTDEGRDGERGKGGEEDTKIQRQKPKIRQKLTKILSDGEKIMERRPGYKSAKIKYSLAVAKKKKEPKELRRCCSGRLAEPTDWQTGRLTNYWCCPFYMLRIFLFLVVWRFQRPALHTPTSPPPPLAIACAVCVTSDYRNALCGTAENRKHFSSRCTNRSASKLTII